MPALVAALLVYLFPKEVLAKLLLILFRRLAKCTKWTTIDDEFLAVMEKHLGEESNARKSE